jgi:hypothetical protein
MFKYEQLSETAPRAIKGTVNPLTPKLNPSAQRYPTRFLLGILLL